MSNVNKEFYKPDSPFLLLYIDTDESVSYAWFETEKELLNYAHRVISYGFKIINAIEVDKCRDIEIERKS